MIPIKIAIVTFRMFEIKNDLDELTIIPIPAALRNDFKIYDPVQLKETIRRVVMIVRNNKREYDIKVDQAAAIYP